MGHLSKPLQARVAALRLEVIEIADQHNAEAHGGGKCAGISYYLTALVGHTLGLHTEAHVAELAEEIYQLEIDCPCHDEKAPKEG